MPVAMVDSTGTSPVLYFIHTDQLGTPQKLTDGSMNVVWDGVFDPFGNPASGASLALTNLRFPGQYADGETALNQNWNRDYDSATGRYIQSDPIGLIGGVNTYAYVKGNPIANIDVMGLATECEDKPHCEELNRIDTATCNQITKRRGAAAGAACHASASERFAACLRGRPLTDLPPLNIWNNRTKASDPLPMPPTIPTEPPSLKPRLPWWIPLLLLVPFPGNPIYGGA